MKKSIIILGMLGFSLTYAQQDNNGKVGINTENPTEVLDVNGNTRIRSLIDGRNTIEFPYNVVAKEDGTLGKIDRGNSKWILYDMDANMLMHKPQDLEESNTDSSGESIKAEFTQELNGSEIYITIPNEKKILTLINWNVWLHLRPIKTEPQQGSLRYFVKYQEVDQNNTPINNAVYTTTVYMISFAGVRKVEDMTKGIYRISASPSLFDKGRYFKSGKRYKISLTYGIESISNGVIEIKNWGVTVKGESFFENRK